MQFQVVFYVTPISVLKCSNYDLINTLQQQSLQHLLWFYFKPYTQISKNSTHTYCGSILSHTQKSKNGIHLALNITFYHSLITIDIKHLSEVIFV